MLRRILFFLVLAANLSPTNAQAQTWIGREVRIDTLAIRSTSAIAGLKLGRNDTTWQKIFRDSTVWYTKNLRRMWLDVNGTLSGVFSTQTGSVIGGEYLTNGTVIANKLIASAQAFSSSIVFSDSSDVIVKWTAGYVRLASSTAYSIPAGNTGTMSTLTYIYLNTIGQTWGFVNALDVSTGNMQIGNDADGFTATQGAERTWTNGRSYIRMNGTTYLPGVNDQIQVRSALYQFYYETTPTLARQFNTNTGLTDSINANVPGVYANSDGTTIVLTGKAGLTVTTAYANIAADSVILLAVAKPASVASSKAFYVPAVGSLGINGDNILVNSINANHIIANTITTGKLDAITTDAIYSSLGTAVAGSIEIGSTNKLWLNYLGDGNLRIGGSVYANAPFQVSAAGVLMATTGTFKTVTSGNRVEIGLSGTNTIGFWNSTNSYGTLLSSAVPTVNRSIILPNADGAIITEGNLSSITSTGVITSGTWQATVIGTAYTSAKIASLNTLTGETQTFATGTTGTNFNISSSGTTHTFNIPDASGSARGVVTTGAQTFAGLKYFESTLRASDILIKGGLASYGTYLSSSATGSDKTMTFPDATGTVITTGNLSSITATGTIASGTWQGTAIANAYVADLPTSKITSGTFLDARIAASNVTQHQASLSIATSQLTGTISTAQIGNNQVTSDKTSGLTYGSGAVTAITVVNGLVTAIVP